MPSVMSNAPSFTRLIGLFAAFVGLLVPAARLTADPAAPSVDALLESSDRARGGGLPGLAWTIEIVSTDEDGQSRQVLSAIARDNDSRVDYTAPEKSKGQFVIILGRNMWFSRPGLRKPVPLSPRQRLVGGHLTHERASVHGWAQGTVSDAVIVYGEAGWSEGAASLYPERGPSPTGWSLQPRGGDARRLKAIVGGAYTLLSGATVTVEVWRNGDAWGADRRGQVAEALRALVRQPFGIADGQIGGILTTLPEPYGRHRAGVQLANAGDVRTAWLVRYTHGIDEGGGEWLGYLRRDLSDSLQVWGSAAWRTGGERSAYGLGVRSAVSVGLTWMPW